MPEIVACPECGRKLRVPDEFLGRKVKCPQCSAMFLAEAAGGGGKTGGKSESGGKREESLADRAAARAASRKRDDEEEEDRPRSRRRDEEDEEEERPRSRRSSRDDDEDDRPSRRRGRDEDEDDYDDRPSRRSNRDRDYDDEDDDRRRGPSPKQEKAGWKSVSFGLLFVIISNWLTVSYIAVSFLWTLMLFALLWTGAYSIVGYLGYAVNILLLLMVIGHFVTNVTGHGFTLATPGRPDWSTKPLAISGFSCLASSTACFALYMLWMVVIFGPLAFGIFFGATMRGQAMLAGQGAASTAPLMAVIALIGVLLNTAGSIVFMFYLNNVSLRGKRNDLARSVIACFIAVVAYILICTLLACLWVAMIPAIMGGAVVRGDQVQAASGLAVMGWISFVFGILILLVGVGLLIWYITLLYQVRGAVDSYVRKSR